ncbi:Phosphatidylinositol 3- and 4-kinase [Phytophthora infestans]|nr:Phosphatidylinositol 3- and 4-kinase [Phytophthora infestans]KAF4139130.1 Phosphatidylinositol 3- and 4-kinase [Phytophthora infestans]KAI9989753.1 hypothetical protein PInf_020040 [Phytophthora infestans]
MSEVVSPGDLRLSLNGKKTTQDNPVNSEEARQAAPAQLGSTHNDFELQKITEPQVKENKWKLAFRQLMFMKRMNMQFNDRTKNEIELRQQHISPTSLICSVPYFNAFSAEEIKNLVAASRRVRLRPGETLSLGIANANLQQEGDFCVVISGNLALSKASVPSTMALNQASLYPQLRLGIGDYFSVHDSSDMKVIAMELAEYLTIPMKTILEINAASAALIDADKNDLAPEASEMESFKKWALQFSLIRQKSEYPATERGGFANCSVKTFCKDHFPNITPENELDHTLEYLKNALTSIFSARKVRIYALDKVNNALVIKFSDERLSKRSVDITSSTGQRVLETGGPICVKDAVELLRDELDEDDVARELYQPDTIVLAAPFFEFDAMQTNGGSTGTAKIVGVLEVIIEPSDHEGDVGSATSNDFCILEFVTEEIGRYLFFHYERFFYVSSHTDTAPPGATGTCELELFPSPPEGPVQQDHRQLVLNIGKTHLNISETISVAKISIQHGSTVLYETSTLLRYESHRDSHGDKSHLSSTSREVTCDPSGGIEMGLRLIDMPHGSHLKFTFTTKAGDVIAWSGLHLFDFGHTLRTGSTLMEIVMLPAGSGIITPLDIENCLRHDKLNRHKVGSMEVTLELSGSCPQSFAFSSISSSKKKSIAFRASIFFKRASERKSESREILSLETIPVDKQRLLQRLRRDPLVDLSADDRTFIWTSRLMLMEDSALLPAFLLSVDWGHREQVLEAYRLLLHWKQPTYLQALQLLSPLYSDPKVRAYAVRCMHALPDYRLQLYLLQLVQALKNERYHDSALARFLLMRALTNPSQIGYLLYWFLKAESHNQQTAERFNLISSQYLQLCGNYKLEIRQSVYVMKKLEEVAAIVKSESSSTARKEKLHKALEAVVFPDTFQLPLQPRSYCTRVIVESCRVMESKKRPLFLQFESAKAQHGRPYVIFKAGDDLRQDQLVLQILRVMDDLWREAGLDLCLLPYACISTGDEIGMIEVVGDSETLASIIYARHAKSITKLGRKLNAAKDALIKDGVLSEWLYKQPGSPTNKARATSADAALDAVSPTGSAPSSPAKDEERARSISSCFPKLSPRRRKKSTSSRDSETTQNFVRSCAGYCVATYVLGIGDRHNDNIMLQRSGKFFHIDFGHFLGNFKSKLGVKRERAPFVFTPSMLDTMGGKKSENYQQFQQLACEAFQVLRTNSNLLITLLVLALTCGIPELHSANCIKWVHKTLMLDLPDNEASEAFKKLIHVALHTTTTKLNDAVHLMAH